MDGDSGIWIAQSGTASVGGNSNIAGGVSIGEPHSLFRKPVQIGRFVERASITTEVRPTKIIHQNKDNVEFVRSCRGRRSRFHTLYLNTIDSCCNFVPGNLSIQGRSAFFQPARIAFRVKLKPTGIRAGVNQLIIRNEASPPPGFARKSKTKAFAPVLCNASTAASKPRMKSLPNTPRPPRERV